MRAASFCPFPDGGTSIFKSDEAGTSAGGSQISPNSSKMPTKATPHSNPHNKNPARFGGPYFLFRSLYKNPLQHQQKTKARQTENAHDERIDKICAGQKTGKGCKFA